MTDQIARKAPCPCGSGKRYKNCCGKTAAVTGASSSNWKTAALAVGGFVVLVLGAQAWMERARQPGAGAGVTDFRTIDGVDLSFLTPEERGGLLAKTNQKRCQCRCGMTLAQCINTDRTCPLRRRNLDRVQRMAAEATRGS